MSRLSCLAFVCVGTQASAHSGIPRAFEIIEGPGNPGVVVLRSDVWGFFRTMDGGQTWQWTCAEAYGGNSLSIDHANIAIAPGGRVLVANAFKGLRITDDFCDWKTSPDFEGELVEDVILLRTNPFVLTSTYQETDGGGGFIDGRIWRSTDNGDHFARLGTPLPPTFAGYSLRFAPSDPKRVYVAGRILNASAGVMERSDDGGATWKASAFAVTDDSMTLRIAGVHGTRPDVVFVWGDLPEGLGTDAQDEVWGTANGGETWSLVYRGSGDLPGFAFSPDGTEIAVAGPLEGVQKASVDAALTRGQSAFTQVFAGKVWGLHWSSTGLTAGNDNFTPAGLPAFTYGRSIDDGASFSALMSLCQVNYDACSPPSSAGTLCQAPRDSLVDGFIQTFNQGSQCTPAGQTSASGGEPGTDPLSSASAGGAGSILARPSDAGGSPSADRERQLRITQGCAIERSGASPRSASLCGVLLAGALALARRRRGHLPPRSASSQ